MSKQKIPLYTDDLSAFARVLATQLKSADESPGHLSLMNMLARANGFRNFQHLRSAHQAGARLSKPVEEEPTDHKLVEKALYQFDKAGRLTSWPSKRKIQDVCLWVLWARLPSDVTLQEREVNTLLNTWHVFEDAALLRRSLFSAGLVTRNLDGSDYRRKEQRPPPEARALIRHVVGGAAS
jgi:hypothetical protein